MIKRLTVSIPASHSQSYPILMATGLLTKINSWLPNSHNIVIITDHTVKKLYGKQLTNLLKKHGKNVLLLSFVPGEKSKTITTKCRLESAMLRKHYNRDTVILALGGGVVGDIAGFIAATYMRGIPFIQIPTTLLAMVDSSVGGKTGIDTPQGKNLIGVFWQPHAVVTDLHCLTTLPPKHLINGLLEAIKIFLTCDAKSFHYTVKNNHKILSRDKNILAAIIQRAIKLKAHIVEQDEKENNLRMILNFGHTIGHALEHISNYKILHGHAVGYGILVESKIAELLGHLSPNNFNAIADGLSQLDIHATHLKKYDINRLIQATKIDKKSIATAAQITLLTDIGQIYHNNKRVAHPISANIIKQAFLALTE
jgi:3-dehydroquinate synthase